MPTKKELLEEAARRGLIDSSRPEYAELLRRADGGGALKFVDDVARRVASGLTLGSADEFAAGMNTLTGLGEKRNIKDIVTGDNRTTYQKNLDAERARDAEFFESNPKTAWTAEIAAGVASPVNKALGLIAGPSLLGLGKWGRYAFQGGAGGALGGAASATEGNRTTGAVLGGLTGAALGTALPGAMEIGTGAVRNILGRINSPVEPWARRLSNAFKRDGMTAQQAQQRLSDLGPEATMADLGGNVTGLARAAAAQPGLSLKAAEGLRTRQGGAGDRLTAAALDAVGVRSVDDLITAQQKAAAPLYERALDPKNILNTSGMDGDAQALLKMAQEAVKSDRIIGPQFRNLPDDAMPLIDEAKKYIDGLIGVAQRAGDKNRVRILVTAKEKILDRANHQFPEYKAAREAWGGPQETIDAMNFIRETAEGADDFSNIAKKLFGKKETRVMLGKLFPSPEAFNKFAAAVERERTFFETQARVLGNSSTQFTNAAQADMAPDVADGVFKFAERAQGGSLQLLMDIAKGGVNALRRPPTEVADELAGPLFSSDPAVKQRAFDELARRTSLGSILNRPGMQRFGQMMTPQQRALMTGAKVCGYAGGQFGGSNQ